MSLAKDIFALVGLICVATSACAIACAFFTLRR